MKYFRSYLGKYGSMRIEPINNCSQGGSKSNKIWENKEEKIYSTSNPLPDAKNEQELSSNKNRLSNSVKIVSAKLKEDHIEVSLSLEECKENKMVDKNGKKLIQIFDKP